MVGSPAMSIRSLVLPPRAARCAAGRLTSPVQRQGMPEGLSGGTPPGAIESRGSTADRDGPGSQRRGASLIHLRTTRVEASPRRCSLFVRRARFFDIAGGAGGGFRSPRKSLRSRRRINMSLFVTL